MKYETYTQCKDIARMEVNNVKTENPTAESQETFKISGFAALQLRLF